MGSRLFDVVVSRWSSALLRVFLVILNSFQDPQFIGNGKGEMGNGKGESLPLKEGGAQRRKIEWLAEPQITKIVAKRHLLAMHYALCTMHYALYFPVWVVFIDK